MCNVYPGSFRMIVKLKIANLHPNSTAYFQKETVGTISLNFRIPQGPQNKQRSLKLESNFSVEINILFKHYIAFECTLRRKNAHMIHIHHAHRTSLKSLLLHNQPLQTLGTPHTSLQMSDCTSTTPNLKEISS